MRIYDTSTSSIRTALTLFRSLRNQVGAPDSVLYNDDSKYSSSLERVRYYLQIEHEPPSLETGEPPAYWPAGGDLRVEKLSARYSDGMLHHFL